MAFEYVNRKGDRYYLQAGTTRTGKPRYYFGREVTGTPLENMPEEYEAYERPETAQVYVRKSEPTTITAQEREIVADGIRRYAGLEYFLVDVQGNSLVVYLPLMEEASADRLLKIMVDGELMRSAQAAEAKQAMIRHSQFIKMMRFLLVDAKQRSFAVERWCFRGSIDDWVYLAGPGRLADLVQKYARALGKDDFYELI
jgi:hypothetical protein